MIDVSKLKKGVKVRYLGGDPNDVGDLTRGREYAVDCVDQDGDAIIWDDDGCEWCIGALSDNVDCFEIVDETQTQPDNVEKPAHYTQGGVEVIDIIRQAVVGADGFEAACLANVVKYVMRYRHKNGVEDLRKAGVYLEWLIDDVELRQKAQS